MMFRSSTPHGLALLGPQRMNGMKRSCALSYSLRSSNSGSVWSSTRRLSSGYSSVE
jgi:hypothetical protein